MLRSIGSSVVIKFQAMIQPAVVSLNLTGRCTANFHYGVNKYLQPVLASPTVFGTESFIHQGSQDDCISALCNSNGRKYT